MPQRLRLYDMRISRLPSVIGVCKEDIFQIANAVNTAQSRLLFCRESGDEGWWGTWAEMEFSVERANPYITTPRDVARIHSMTVCNDVVSVQNQFYQYLQFGNGTLPKTCQTNSRCEILQTYTKNNVPLFVDPPTTPFLVRVVTSEDADFGRRMLIEGLDSNSLPIHSQDGLNPVTGKFMQLEASTSFVTWPMQFSRITGIQKDVTHGQVRVYSVDPTTGDETLLVTMQPMEQTAWYRRFYLSPVPASCCGSTSPIVGIKAIVKLELLPCAVDTDYLLFQNREAIIEEAQSVRYSEIDSPTAKQMAQEKHAQAVRLLNGELTHYLGVMNPALEFKPFGTARLEQVAINMI